MKKMYILAGVALLALSLGACGSSNGMSSREAGIRKAQEGKSPAEIETMFYTAIDTNAASYISHEDALTNGQYVCSAMNANIAVGDVIAWLRGNLNNPANAVLIATVGAASFCPSNYPVVMDWVDSQ